MKTLWKTRLALLGTGVVCVSLALALTLPGSTLPHAYQISRGWGLEESVAAMVNGEPITRAQVDALRNYYEERQDSVERQIDEAPLPDEQKTFYRHKYVKPEKEDRVYCDELIFYKIICREADRLGLTVSDTEAYDRAVEYFDGAQYSAQDTQANPSAGFEYGLIKERMRRHGWSREDYIRQMMDLFRVQLRTDRVVETWSLSTEDTADHGEAVNERLSELMEQADVVYNPR